MMKERMEELLNLLEGLNAEGGQTWTERRTCSTLRALGKKSERIYESTVTFAFIYPICFLI